jgi:hypothetical protein
MKTNHYTNLPKVKVGNNNGHNAPVLFCFWQALGIVGPLLPYTRQCAVPDQIGLK